MNVLAVDVGDKTVKLCLLDRREGKVIRQYRQPITEFLSVRSIVDSQADEIDTVVYGTVKENREKELQLLFFDLKLIKVEKAAVNVKPSVTLDIGAQKTSIDRRRLAIGGEATIRARPDGSFGFGIENRREFQGPACYGLGGESLTLVDVHMLLGRLYPYDFLEYNHFLQPKQSYQATLTLAHEIGINPYDLVQRVLEQVNHLLTEEVKSALKERNIQAGETNLVALGGLGPLHAIQIAESAGLAGVFIPPYPQLGVEINQFISKHLKNADPQDGGWHRPASLALLKRLEGLFRFEEKLEHVELSFYRRDKLFPHAIVYGPCVITQLGSTVFIPPYCQAIVEEDRSLRIEVS